MRTSARITASCDRYGYSQRARRRISPFCGGPWSINRMLFPGSRRRGKSAWFAEQAPSDQMRALHYLDWKVTIWLPMMMECFLASS